MNAEPALEGLARVEEHSRMVEDIAGRFTNLEARFDRAETNNIARFEHLERKIDGVRDELGGKIDQFRGELDGKIDGKIDRLDGKMTSYFTWMIGAILASWLTLMYQGSHAIR